MDIKLDLPDAPDVTLSTLDRAARPFCVHYDGWNLEDSVEVFNGVIGQNGELICDGDFVKLASSFSPVSFVYINEEVGICKLMQYVKRTVQSEFVFDFRQLNAVTPLVRYWVPLLDEILHKIGQSTCLSTLDLTSGFHQITMDKKSSNLTTFVFPLGKYKYVRMSFGLKNAPAIFQVAVETVLSPVNDISCNYVNNVVVYSDSWENHLSDLKKVIQCLHTSGFTIKRNKCCFGRKHLTYLGHRIGGGGLSIPQCRVDSLMAFRKPNTKKEMRSFLGAMSYYRRFIPGFDNLSAYLTPSVSLRTSNQVEWTADMEHSFSELRRLLSDHVVLCVPRQSDDLVLYTDASGEALEPVFTSFVMVPNSRLPSIADSSVIQKKITQSRNSSLAIVAAIRHFERLVYGKSLKVVTDHKACLALQSGRGLNHRLLQACAN